MILGAQLYYIYCGPAPDQAEHTTSSYPLQWESLETFYLYFCQNQTYWDLYKKAKKIRKWFRFRGENTMDEEMKWSGPGGWIWFTPVVGIRCAHYIEQKDCTARFATGAIWEFPD